MSAKRFKQAAITAIVAVALAAVVALFAQCIEIIGWTGAPRILRAEVADHELRVLASNASHDPNVGFEELLLVGSSQRLLFELIVEERAELDEYLTAHGAAVLATASQVPPDRQPTDPWRRRFAASLDGIDLAGYQRFYAVSVVLRWRPHVRDVTGVIKRYRENVDVKE